MKKGRRRTALPFFISSFNPLSKYQKTKLQSNAILLSERYIAGRIIFIGLLRNATGQAEADICGYFIHS
jgi:hypothetical protein